MGCYQPVFSPKCVLILVITQFFYCFATAKTRNSLERGSSLSVEDDSDFLISPDKSFTCGFYGVGTNADWFSIWFTHSKDRTVVWMANRERPVNGMGSRVSLSRDGSMVLRDVDGTIVRESSTSTPTGGAERAELLNSGNLVLKDSQGKTLWQSFDFPTDTLLPNQPFTKSMKLKSICWEEGTSVLASVFKGMPSRASERGGSKSPQGVVCFASCTFSAGKA
ncbi:hypothetical protein CerSpe_181910 [Prunus speciosa]